MSAPKGPRPITRAWNIVARTKFNFALNAYILEPDDRGELLHILDSRDASSDTPDSKRKARPSRRSRGSAKKAAR